MTCQETNFHVILVKIVTRIEELFMMNRTFGCAIANIIKFDELAPYGTSAVQWRTPITIVTYMF